jgi:hypothetical protein
MRYTKAVRTTFHRKGLGHLLFSSGTRIQHQKESYSSGTHTMHVAPLFLELLSILYFDIASPF